MSILKHNQCHITIVRDDGVPANLSDRDIFTTVYHTLCASNVMFGAGAQIEVTVVFVSDVRIQELNRTYRGKDAPTDVLSFPDDFAHENAPGVDHQGEGIVVDGAVVLGDIVLSCATIERYATMDSVPYTQALTFVLAHGVLHLLGYNHSAMMFAIQDTVTKYIHEAGTITSP